MEESELFQALRQAMNQHEDFDDLEAEIWDRFGRTCAILVLDSTRFSRTTQLKGIVYFLSILAKLRNICQEVFPKHNAIHWRAEADNMFAEFPDVSSAVASAFEIHRILRKKGYLLDDHVTFKACIGIGYGRVLWSEGEGVFGDEMNLAAKLGEDLAEGGETLLTEEAYVNLKNRDGIDAQRRFIELSAVDIPYFSIFEE